MWNDGFIDIPAAYRVFHRVNTVLQGKAEGAEKASSRERISKYIKENVLDSKNQLGGAHMQGEKIAMDKADRLWLMHII